MCMTWKSGHMVPRKMVIAYNFRSRSSGLRRPTSRLSCRPLRDAFDESDLPFRVDVHIWDRLPDSFHKHITEDYLILHSKSRIDHFGLIILQPCKSVSLYHLPMGRAYRLPAAMTKVTYLCMVLTELSVIMTPR